MPRARVCRELDHAGHLEGEWRWSTPIQSIHEHCATIAIAEAQQCSSSVLSLQEKKGESVILAHADNLHKADVAHSSNAAAMQAAAIDAAA